MRRRDYRNPAEPGARQSARQSARYRAVRPGPSGRRGGLTGQALRAAALLAACFGLAAALGALALSSPPTDSGRGWPELVAAAEAQELTAKEGRIEADFSPLIPEEGDGAFALGLTQPVGEEAVTAALSAPAQAMAASPGATRITSFGSEDPSANQMPAEALAEGGGEEV